MKSYIQPPAPCDGLRCRPGVEEHFFAKAPSWDAARQALADLTDTVAKVAKIPPDEAEARVVRYELAAERLSKVPINGFHAHLVVPGIEPGAEPWYFALEEVREDR